METLNQKCLAESFYETAQSMRAVVGRVDHLFVLFPL
jgi:hypothetical protein